MNIRTIIRAHLSRERLDVLIAVLVPFILMLESGYANGWTFAQGHVDLREFNTYWSMTRGLFLEGLIYACFKMVRMFVLHPRWAVKPIALVPLVIGYMAMTVSAGCNLAWVNQSGEMSHLVGMVQQFMPEFMVNSFKLGLGLLFPLAVGAFALLDVSQLIEELLKSAHLTNRATTVEIAEIHSERFKKAQKEAVKEVESQYTEMAKADAQNMVNRVRKGDYSFGLDQLPPSQSGSQSSATRIQALPALPSLPAGPAFGGPALPFAPASQNTMPMNALTGQVMPAGPSTGNTTNLQYPPPPPPEKKFLGLF